MKHNSTQLGKVFELFAAQVRKPEVQSKEEVTCKFLSIPLRSADLDRIDDPTITESPVKDPNR